MNKSESKYFNTALLMDQALIRLLEEKDIEYISVKEICEKAGVNRSTFYLHYETIGDLIEETVEYVTGNFQDAFQNANADFVEQIPELPLNELVLVTERYLTPYLQFIYENKGVFKAAVKNPSSMKTFDRYARLQQYIIEPIMERFHVPKSVQSYWTAYYMKGIWAVIEEWLYRDCIETVEQIEKIIIKCVRPEAGLQD
jgi:AcrR family transcriptional regulator